MASGTFEKLPIRFASLTAAESAILSLVITRFNKANQP